jgi:hypothetical protein
VKGQKIALESQPCTEDLWNDFTALHGLAVFYKKAGFREVARRSETRPVIRYEIKS